MIDAYTDPAWLAFPRLPVDDDGAVFVRKGRRYFHPVATAQAALSILPTDRTEAMRLALVLLRHAEQAGQGLRWSYGFDFEYRGPIVAPWYSGMAQGQAASLYTRLGMLDVADAALIGMAEHLHLCDGGTWISEYPTDADDPTLNGHVFGLMGVWDYWRAAAGYGELLREGLRVIRPYRDVMAANWYDRDAQRRAESYADIHRWQLRWLDGLL